MTHRDKTTRPRTHDRRRSSSLDPSASWQPSLDYPPEHRAHPFSHLSLGQWEPCPIKPEYSRIRGEYGIRGVDRSADRTIKAFVSYMDTGGPLTADDAARLANAWNAMGSTQPAASVASMRTGSARSVMSWNDGDAGSLYMNGTTKPAQRTGRDVHYVQPAPRTTYQDSYVDREVPRRRHTTKHHSSRQDEGKVHYYRVYRN